MVFNLSDVSSFPQNLLIGLGILVLLIILVAVIWYNSLK
jgi:hypothetical protein